MMLVCYDEVTDLDFSVTSILQHDKLYNNLHENMNLLLKLCT